MIEFVFLDLDDTVLDFHCAEAEAVKVILQNRGIDSTPAVIARYSAINDAQWKRLETGELTRAEVKLLRFAILFEELGVACDAESARTEYEERLSHGHWFIEGAEALLHELHGRYRLFLVSNGTTAVQRGRMASAGIAPLFEEIFLSEELGYVKPQREFFDACFASINGFDLTRAIILGDSLTSDIRGGKGVGMQTCWFNPRGEQAEGIVPDHEIRHLDEFAPLLEKI